MQHVQSAAHDSAPSYVRHERQPLATGTYHPLAKSNETLSPVDFRARRRAALYTHKNALCAAPSRKSIFTPTAPASAPHISTDVLTTAHTGQYRPADSVSPSNEPAPQTHTPQNARHSIGDHRAWFCTSRTGHRQSGQNHHTYHPHRRHQSTRRLAYVHQLQSRPTHRQILQERARLVEKAYEILLRLLHHRVLPAYLS